MYDAIVLGAGAMGSAAAYHLAARGASVLAIEQFEIGHARGSSHGRSRIIRLAYWEHPAYVPLLRRAYELWRGLEAAAGGRLLRITGSIDAGPQGGRHMLGARRACREFDLPHEEFDAGGLRAKYPAYRLPDDFAAVYQPDGGILAPERCVRAHVAAAAALGAVIRTGERVVQWSTRGDGCHVRTDRASYGAHRLIVTAGAWTGTVVPSLAPALVPERQIVLWTRPLVPGQFTPGAFPVFYLDGEEGRFYGFPDTGDGFKIGKYHHRGQAADPDALDRVCHPEDERVIREGIARYFPAANGPTLAAEPCLFTNTADEHFLIDRAPGESRVIVAAGFSGHGFKFATVVGEILADLALDGGTRHAIALFGCRT